MTGIISTNGVFSRLTFALYEDSGYVPEWLGKKLPVNSTCLVQYYIIKVMFVPKTVTIQFWLLMCNSLCHVILRCHIVAVHVQCSGL